VIIPAVTGERLSDSSDFEIALELYRTAPGFRGLDPEAAIQAWIFQQFLILLLMTPVAGSMAVAAYSVIGEKQARTLEPLLATPLTTFELLAAKVLGSFIPALGLLGPLAALAALQLAVCVSSRVNDARSAQQIGALIILPISGLLVAQVTGFVVLTGTVIALIALALAALNVALMRVGIVLFDRESILTRWK
jgi:ABC-2 type transport system permease protein